MKKVIKKGLLQVPGISRVVRIYTRVPHGPRGIRKVGHRSYVGGLWEEIGRLQFEFLLQEGLQPHHFLLDIGCGSLRGGIHFIPFLDPGHYLGVDKEKILIQAGLEQELDPAVLAEREPRFVISDRFDFDRLELSPDYALALSVFTHLPSESIRLCCRNLRRVVEDSSLFYATFFETDQAVKNPRKPHDHARFEYTRGQMEALGRETGWRAEFPRRWNHPRGQVMVKYSPC